MQYVIVDEITKKKKFEMDVDIDCEVETGIIIVFYNIYTGKKKEEHVKNWLVLEQK